MKSAPDKPVEAARSTSLRHVAQLAGVSIATASRVMSGSDHPVGERTRQRVLAAASALAFEPNRLARALVTARSHTVGVVVHDISDPYFGDFVKGLEDGLFADDYHLFVASSDRIADKELSYVRAFDAQRVDGIVFAASSLTDPAYTASLIELVGRYRQRGGVVVVTSGHCIDGPRVMFDNRAATAEMVRYLASLGHSRIGFIAGPPALEVSAARQAGYEGAMAELGLEIAPGWVTGGGFTVPGGGRGMAEMDSSVTAVLAANDLMAIGATRHLLSQGRSVPAAVSVAGIDDIHLAEYAPVPLTTMRVPTYEMGRQGAAVLLAALRGEEPDDPVVAGEIVVRDSTAAPP